MTNDTVEKMVDNLIEIHNLEKYSEGSYKNIDARNALREAYQAGVADTMKRCARIAVDNTDYAEWGMSDKEAYNMLMEEFIKDLSNTTN